MNDTTIAILAALAWLAVNAGIGYWIGTLGAKRNGALGGILGALLAPLGWIIVAVLPAEAGKPSERPSPQTDDSFRLIISALGICTLAALVGIACLKLL